MEGPAKATLTEVTLRFLLDASRAVQPVSRMLSHALSHRAAAVAVRATGDASSLRTFLCPHCAVLLPDVERLPEEERCPTCFVEFSRRARVRGRRALPRRAADGIGDKSGDKRKRAGSGAAGGAAHAAEVAAANTAQRPASLGHAVPQLLSSQPSPPPASPLLLLDRRAKASGGKKKVSVGGAAGCTPGAPVAPPSTLLSLLGGVSTVGELRTAGGPQAKSGGAPPQARSRHSFGQPRPF